MVNGSTALTRGSSRVGWLVFIIESPSAPACFPQPLSSRTALLLGGGSALLTSLLLRLPLLEESLGDEDVVLGGNAPVWVSSQPTSPNRASTCRKISEEP